MTNILAVDDSPSMRQRVTYTLESGGYSCHCRMWPESINHCREYQ